MPYDLKKRNVLVIGGSRGLGALICEKFAAEGSNIVVNYVTSKDRANQVVEKCESFGVKSAAIQGNVELVEDCVRLVKEAAEELGGLDIIVNNAGWTKFTKFSDLNALTYEEWDKCWHINVMSQLVLLREAVPLFNANEDGGVFLITSSVAGLSLSSSSMGYSVSKAAGLHLMKCLASTQGPKIRVNAILPGLMLTEWGLQFTEEQLQANKDKAVLKKETDLIDCADTFIFVARNSSITGREIVVDSGLALK